MLFSPITIKDKAISNRIFVAPMCQYSAKDGIVNYWHEQHYGKLAVGGAGALTIEATAVSPEGRITEGCLGLYTDKQEEEITLLVKNLKAISPVSLGLQLSHAGRKGACSKPWEGGKSLKESSWSIISPSATAFGHSSSIPMAMDERDFERVLESYAVATRRALRAGFDYLELHLAHGYLLSSFLSPISNKRNDQYGKSLKNRIKFPLAVVAKVRSIWPENLPFGVRINSHDWVDGGLTFTDTIEICQWLQSVGIDFICVSAGAISEGVRIPAKPGYLLDFAEQIKKTTGIKTRGVGLLYEPKLIEQAIAEEKVDCVAIGRAMLANPNWAYSAANELGVNIDYPPQYLLSHPSKWIS